MRTPSAFRRAGLVTALLVLAAAPIAAQTHGEGGRVLGKTPAPQPTAPATPPPPGATPALATKAPGPGTGSAGGVVGGILAQVIDPVGGAPWIDLGGGSVGAAVLAAVAAPADPGSGIANLPVVGVPAASGLSVTLAGAAPGSPGLLLASTGLSPRTFRGGILMLDLAAPSCAIALVTDALGGWSATASWPSGVLAETTLFLQALVPGSAAPGGVSLSNALQGEIPPGR